MYKKVGLVSVIIGLIVVVFKTSAQTSMPTAPLPSVSMRLSTIVAPDFALRSLNGKDVRLADLLSDKPLVLVFWASWCPPCRKKMPHLQELHSRYSDKLNIVGINLDRKIQDAQRFVKKKGVTFLILFDQDAQVAKKYGIKGIPSNVIINSKGEIMDRDLSISELKQLATTGKY